MTDTLKQLTKIILWINKQGWSPATSTNYSLRDTSNCSKCYVSGSGIDKSVFTENDFIRMNLNGSVDLGYETLKPSAETEIHLSLYKLTDCNVVLHTHSKSDTLLSRLTDKENKLSIEGYELLKGLRNIETHEARVNVPVFANNQNISMLSKEIESHLSLSPETKGILIESHGFYTWGRSLAEAKRHLEVFQFLFDCELTLKLINS